MMAGCQKEFFIYFISIYFIFIWSSAAFFFFPSVLVLVGCLLLLFHGNNCGLISGI